MKIKYTEDDDQQGIEDAAQKNEKEQKAEATTGCTRHCNTPEQTLSKGNQEGENEPHVNPNALAQQ
jgi:hypothetical protein